MPDHWKEAHVSPIHKGGAKIHLLSSSGLVFIGMLRRLVSAYSKAIFRSIGSY